MKSRVKTPSVGFFSFKLDAFFTTHVFDVLGEQLDEDEVLLLLLGLQRSRSGRRSNSALPTLR